MKKLYWVISAKYRIFKKTIISYTFEKTLVLSIICSKCEKEDEKIFIINWDIKNNQLRN